MIGNILLAIDFTNFSQNFVEWALTPFTTYLGVTFWAIIFVVVIAFTYLITNNLSSTVAVIFLVFAIFGTTEAILSTPELSLFFGVVAAAGIAGTLVVLYLKRQGD